MLSRLLAALLTAVAVGASAVPALAQAPSGKGATVRFQTYNSFGELLFRIMEERYCEKYDLKCSGVLIPAGPLGIQSLVGNSIEVAFASTDAIIRAIAGGADARIFLGLMSRVPFHVVARSDIERPNKGAGYPAVMKDFKGKRIGVTGRGAGVELVFDLLLRAAGMSPNDVTYVGVGGPPTAFGSLQSKQIDGLILFQPIPGMCTQSKICEPVLDLSKGEGPDSVKKFTGAATTALAKREYIEKNPHVLRAFVAAAREAERWMTDPANYDQVKAIANRHVKMTMPGADVIFEAALKEQISNTDTNLSRNALKAYVELLHERNLISQRLDVKHIAWSDAPGR